MPRDVDLVGLAQFAETDKERTILETVTRHKLAGGNVASAAQELKRSERNVLEWLSRMRSRRDMSGILPSGSPGTTTLVNQDGEIKLQWQRAAQNAERAAMKAFVEGLAEEVKPRKRIPKSGTKIPKAGKDLLVAYPIGDHHTGMYAWAEETLGADYDLDEAERLLHEATDYLVDSSPAAEQALMVNLGDFIHADNRSNKTPASGHILDVDTRYSKVAKTAARALCYATERLLAKHKTVRVVNVPGNHDPDSTYWLSIVLEAWFRNEPRVAVDMSPAKFLFHQFGKNMLCMTHGDRLKLQELPSIMAALQPQMWGETIYRYAWTGHVHHSQTVIGKENRGAIAESFGVLPPNDAYGASLGYVSQREMQAIALHREGGEVSRVKYSVRPTM